MNNKPTFMPAACAAVLAALPGVMGLTPAARWGHQAVYVKSKQSMYIVGGEVPTSGSQITNDVLVLPLNSSSAAFTTASSEGLPPHAFASMIVTPDGSSLVVTGGITSSCDGDGTTHTLGLDSNDGWVSTTPNKFLRRRGSAAAYVDNSGKDVVMVVGGIADKYVCSSSTHSYPAADVLSLPLSSSSLISSRSLPTSLTGSEMAVSDFALTTGSDGKVYLTGGQTSSGQFVDMTTIGVWDSSNGWSSQVTTGDIPSGRVGASLVAHPNLDVLVLHGGSTDSSGTPSNLLSFLNTTTWAWSAPSNLQPPASSAAAYHTSVITDQGVMITAFGLSSANTPRSDIYYLDMRDPTGSAWSWKNTWNSNMLAAYEGSSGSTSSTGGGNGVTTAKDTSNGSDGMSSKKIASITVPVIIIALLLSPLIIYLIRRRMRLIKKRRMARHFSFSSQEDEGFFKRPSNGLFSRYLSTKKTSAGVSAGGSAFPFNGNARDGNEQEGNFLSRMVTRLSSRSNSDDDHDDIPYHPHPPREMIAVTNKSVTFQDEPVRSPKGKRDDRQMNWEEIDFGLGKLDESKQAPPSQNDNSSINISPFGDHAAPPGPVAFPVANPNSNAGAGGYTDEMLYSDSAVSPPAMNRLSAPGEQPLIPSLFVQPATVPSTPAADNLTATYPALTPASSSAVGGSAPAGGEWDSLAQELESKPAFRSISPTAQLRSHAHSQPSGGFAVGDIYGGIRSESPRPISPAPSIPPLEFQNQMDAHSQSHVQTQRPASVMSSHSVSSQKSNGTIRLVSSTATGIYGNERRPEFLPFQNVNQGMRSTSQPINRQLVGMTTTTNNNNNNALSRGGSDNYSPLSSGQTTPTPTPRNVSLSYTPGMRRSSGSLIGNEFNSNNNGSPVNVERRSSLLRVVNATPKEGDEGQAM
ncbi:uncharacterized protein I303_108351 [Kwoniella dejecticola CBS 10117]|uniref:Galactose oxidase n=1 Tax=Kwoniella dejecticola CBS 10117 TaxID=1296121 RepID=A0A1A5ZXM2_9TREE|nr:uncharacterized protein I303_07321 [Kwoniella dejecticola CBS 10117]OBR82561.1 hypothetical protein I303_07321 [Kwoniella dejecticola CBS 10117]